MLAGSLRTFAIAELFDWLARRRPTGVVKLDRGSLSRVFHVDGPWLTFASSTVPGEQLSQLLIGAGQVSEADLAEAFRVQGQTGVLLGKILVLTDLIAEAALREVLAGKIRESVCEALTWTEGTFRFTPGPGDASTELPIQIALDEAVRDGAAQVERRRELGRRLPGDAVGFWVVDRDRADGAEPGRLLDCIARGMTVNQMVLEHSGNRLAVLERLAALLDRGAIEKERRARRRATTNLGLDAADAVSAARGRSQGGDREGAWQLCRRSLDDHPESDELRELFRALERGLLAELTRELLADFRVPRLVGGPEALAGAELDDAERYVAGRIDGRWDLLSLIRVAPLGEVEALLAVRRLAARGLIAL